MIAIAKASDTEREVLFGNAADRAGMRKNCQNKHLDGTVSQKM